MINKKILIPLLIFFLLFSVIVLGTPPNFVDIGPTTEFTGDVGVPDGGAYYIGEHRLDMGVLSEWTFTHLEDQLFFGEFAKIEYVRYSNFEATSAPTVNDDTDLGYIVGSLWYDVTADKGYACLDNTNGAAVWIEITGIAGGYTNLTSFVDQTAWRVFYSNTDGDVVELALGTDGQYLKSTGTTSAPIFETPAGVGDMLKAAYDTDEDDDVDVAAGGTEKSSWTQYCIPYLSGATVFGEIPIGTDNYALTVSGATGYDWTHLQVYDAGLLSLAGLTYASDSFIKVTATDTYAIRTLSEVRTDLGLVIGTNVMAWDAQLDDIAALAYINSNFIVGDGSNWVAESGSTARTSLGLIIGTDVQAYDAGLLSIAGLTTAANKMIYTTALDTYAVIDLTAFGRSILDDADEATFKATVNLETGTDVLAEQTIGIGDDNLMEVDDADAADNDYAKFTVNGLEGRDASEVKTDLGFMTDLVDDTDPDLGGQMQAGAHSINFTEQVLTSGTAVAWNLGNSNKAILTAAHNFTITITAPSGALNAQVIITQDGTGTRVMDEIITQADATIVTSDVHTDTEIIDITIDIPTGARIRFDNDVGTDVPEPLVEDTIYYAINEDSTHIKVATTKANAIAGTEIDITDQGTNVHTVEQLVKWPDGTLGVLSTDVGWEDIVSLTYKTADKQWYAQVGLNFQ